MRTRRRGPKENGTLLLRGEMREKSKKRRNRFNVLDELKDIKKKRGDIWFRGFAIASHLLWGMGRKRGRRVLHLL